MGRKRKNSNLNEAPVYTGPFRTAMQCECLVYSPHAIFEKKVSEVDEIQALVGAEAVSWIHVKGMTDADFIIRLAKSFGLSELDAKDILTTQHLITIEEYDQNIFIVLPVTYTREEETVTEQLAIIVGANYLVSIQESDHPLFETLRADIRNRQYLKYNSRKADFLLASILNEVITTYADEVVRLEDRLEDLEDQLLDVKQIQPQLIQNIQENRREMIHLRKLLFPFKDQLAKLLRAESGLIDSRQTPYFKDIYAQLLYILQNLDSCREILSSLVDLYLNNNDLKMNIVMKQLTLIATIFIPLTFLVGVWGMNFKFMPELDWRYGYLLAWALMIGIGVGVWWYIKRKDWM
jgi:magnesium transporter